MWPSFCWILRTRRRRALLDLEEGVDGGRLGGGGSTEVGSVEEASTAGGARRGPSRGAGGWRREGRWRRVVRRRRSGGGGAAEGARGRGLGGGGAAEGVRVGLAAGELVAAGGLGCGRGRGRDLGGMAAPVDPGRLLSEMGGAVLRRRPSRRLRSITFFNPRYADGLAVGLGPFSFFYFPRYYL